MKTPYFITNKNEYEKILKPLLLEWGYHEELNINCGYNIIVLNDCGVLGAISNYTHLEQISLHDRYKEPNIYLFLEKAAELMGKEYKPFFGDKDVIWCPTEELANQVLEIADKLGYSWSTRESFKECSNWSTYKGETCYRIHDGKFAPRNCYQRSLFDIIPAEEFINFYKKYLKMEEKRNIQVTFEQAKEWYRSENQTLKTLALSAYSKEELEALSFEEILYKIKTSSPGFYHVPEVETTKWSALHKLAILAQYFNSKSIKFDTQYFIKGKYEGEIQIGKHVGVRYPGIIYFNNPDYLYKAIKLMGKDIEYLF